MQKQVFFDRLRTFMYRKLARLITCEVKLPGNHPLALDNKYQVTSLEDVFCHPFYWQVYTWVDQPPNFVVDLGAHCAHFSLLADVCFRERFGEVRPEYLLIEPNPALVPVIHRNLAKSGLCPNHVVKQGLVGNRKGCGTLWVGNNYLGASLQRRESAKAVEAEYLDLESLVGGRTIDLLKIDIEGAEYDLVAQYPELLKQVRRMMIEIHSAPESRQSELRNSLECAGLRQFGAAVEHSGHQLAMFERV